MAIELTWSRSALDDIDEIARFISRDSVHYAKGMTRRIFAAAESLSLFPEMGRVVPERDDERYRELIVRPYRLIYKLSAQRVEVLAVIHGAWLLDNVAADRLPPDQTPKPTQE